MRVRSLGLAFVASLWAILDPCAASAGNNLEAVPEEGGVKGARSGGIERFLNIPFAAAPTGALRWRPPQPAPHWQGLRDATRMGPACPQTIRPALVAGGRAEVQSEDCLQLNIWRPAGARNLPVMVWLHGGAHVIGSGTFPAFDGSAFASEGVILVTVNYRLGALGYFAHPALAAEAPAGELLGNYGLMDQIAALRWVKRNIGAFGGNPRSVTVFGESAGANDVVALLTMPQARGLFTRAIVQSGIVLHNPQSLNEEESRGAELAMRAGAIPDATATQLRSLPVDALVRAGDIKSGRALVGPMLDGQLLREAPWRALARGAAIDVPLLVGANSNEASVILAMGVPPAMAASYLGSNAEPGRAAYGTGLSKSELARQVLGDAWFVAPARWLAEQTSRGSPSYLYHFDYVPSSRREGTVGASHGAEVPFVFGTLDYLAALGVPVGNEDRTFAAALTRCWTGFAKRGELRCAMVSGWPRYDPKADRLAWLGKEPKVVAHFRKPQIDHLLSAFFERDERAARQSDLPND